MTARGRWSILGMSVVVLSACPPVESTCADGGACAVAPECSPNPCGGARSVCVARDGGAECRCPEGYAPEGEGCATTPIFDCAAAHPGKGDLLEPDECPAQASTLVLGQPESRHTLAPAGDVDWFAVEGELRHITEVSVTTSDGLLGSAVQAFADDGVSALAEEARGMAQTKMRAKHRGTGKLFLRVRGLPPGTTGGYVLTARDIGLDDVGDTAQDASPADVGTPRAGVLETGDDVDVFTVALLASTKYRFTVSGSPSLHVELREPNDANGLGASDGAPVLIRAKRAGLYLVRITNSLNRFGPYTLTVDDLGPDDCGDDPGDATGLTLGATETGTLEATDDVDAYSIPAQAGHAYSVTASASSSSYGGVSATVIDAKGTDLMPSGGSYGYGQRVFTATADGLVFVLVQATYSGGRQPVSYTLVVTDLGKDDYGDTPSTATTVSAGASGSGRFSTESDVDMLAFPATAPRIYGVSCAFSYPLNECGISVTDQLGLQLARSNGFGSPSSATFLAPTSGTITVAFSSRYDTGPYTWRITDLGLDDCGDDPSSATLLAGPPATGAGAIQYQGDHDVYGFGVDAGLVYQFSCTTPSTSSGGCGLALLDGAGVVLTRASPSYSSSSTVLAWEAQRSETVFVDVTGTGSVSQTYRYGLATNGTDDYGDTRATAAPAVVGGVTAAGHFETPADVDVFTFAATAGHVYQFNCAPSGGPCAAHFSDASGATLRDDGPSSQYSAAPVAVSAKALTTGPLYVSAGPGSTSSWVLTAYQWSIVDLGLDDCGDSVTDATAVTAAGTATPGTFEYGADVDVLRFDALAGEMFRLTCMRPSSSTCQVSVRTAAGQVLGSSSWGSSAIGFKSPAAGTLYATLAPSASFGQGVAGTYTWLLENLGKDDYGDDITSATAIALNTPTSGVLEINSDTDAFSVPLSASASYQVTNALPGSLQVTVYAPNGYAYVTYGSSPPFSFTTSSGAGSYSLLVRPAYSAITPLSYTLTVK